MQCPIDGTALVMTERSGVEIDYCPKCRGVWLDRGELDKIIEKAVPPAPPVALEEPGRRSAPPPPGPAPHSAPPPYRGDDRDYDRGDRDHNRGERYDPRGDDRREWRGRDDDDRYYKRKKRESFLGDLFDF
jgi:uncharacterized protein